MSSLLRQKIRTEIQFDVSLVNFVINWWQSFPWLEIPFFPFHFERWASVIPSKLIVIGGHLQNDGLTVTFMAASNVQFQMKFFFSDTTRSLFLCVDLSITHAFYPINIALLLFANNSYMMMKME